MKLDFIQIKEMTWGAVRVVQEDEYICFYRFSKEQEELLKKRKDEFYRHSLGTAGVRLVFKTDSEKLTLKVKVANISDRKRFSFDVFKNDELIGYLDNFSDVDLPEGEKRMELPVGDFEKTFNLGEGTKKVCIHFPYSAKGMIREIIFDDNATFEPVKANKKMLAYGDSITQGYYALRSSTRYAAKLADWLDAEEINRGIGSDRFCPDLAGMFDDVSVDYLVVAHGTNDWRTNRTREQFRDISNTCYGMLRKLHPEAKIIAISPIWRKDFQDERPYGDFRNIDEDIREVLKDDPNAVVISGFDLVPHEAEYFGDFVLHPNDKGFGEYFHNLVKKI